MDGMMTTNYKPYSYASDPDVPSFDDSKPLIIFDGYCALCSSGVQWMMARDPEGEAVFAAISDDLPRALYLHYGLDPDVFDTFMVLHEGVPHLRWKGLSAAARVMPAPWKWLGSVGRIVPDFIGDAIYDFVQRNRIGWFGARETCFIPDEKSAMRFLS
ncbi:MAG: DCC1-like thiol-disulfide oxidoreductase family protein [Pseudomonadota bacterium]